MDNTESAMQQLGGHLEVFIYRVPKKNHDAIEQNLKKFVPWFEKNGVKIEYYKFGNDVAMEGFESMEKVLSVSGDEEIWMELQYFRGLQHSKDLYAKMMQDKDLEPLGKEFMSLITQGKSLVTGGFNRLK